MTNVFSKGGGNRIKGKDRSVVERGLTYEKKEKLDWVDTGFCSVSSVPVGFSTGFCSVSSVPCPTDFVSSFSTGFCSVSSVPCPGDFVSSVPGDSIALAFPMSTVYRGFSV